MNKINDILGRIEALKSDIRAAQADLQVQFNAIFDDCPELQAEIVALDCFDGTSAALSEDNCVEYWRHSKALAKFKDCQEQLKEYLAGTGVWPDFDNDALIMFGGPQLIISRDGVFDQDSGNWIIDASEYDSDSKRNALIEAWMEKTGYFPGVYLSNNYDNDLTPVNTQERE